MPDAAELAAFSSQVIGQWLIGIHEGIFRVTGGEVLADLLGMDVVLVTTTGRRSGRPRRTILTSPMADDRSIVLVASYGGAEQHPAWYHNMVAHPEVTVLRGGREERMRARVAGVVERATIWPQVTARYPGYGQYQNRTTREIPLVILEVV